MDILTTLQTFFENFGIFLDNIVSFIVSFFEDFAYFISLVGKYYENMPWYIDWFPTSVVPFFFVGFAVIFILRLIGRY